MKKLYEIYQKRIGCTLPELSSYIKSSIVPYIQDANVFARVNSPQTLRNKMMLKNTSNIFNIKDVYGIRIIVQTPKDVYLTLSQIRGEFLGYTKNDFIAKPKRRIDKLHLSGKSVRFVQYIAFRNNTPFEIQITTREFHDENESLHEQYSLEKYFSLKHKSRH